MDGMEDRGNIYIFAQSVQTCLSDFFTSPGKVLGLSIGLGAIFVGLHLALGYDLYNDVAGCYAPMAREAGRGNWAGAMLSWLPPLQPFLAGVLCYLGLSAAAAVLVVSGFFYVAAVGPVYSFLRLYLPKDASAWGCLLYLLAPKILRFGCSGLLESGRNFFVVAILALLLWEWRARSWWRPLLLGLSLGCLAMVRSEGIVFAAPTFALLCLPVFFRIPSLQALLKLGVSLILALVAFCAVLTPRTMQIYHETGYMSPDIRLLEFMMPERKLVHPRLLESTTSEQMPAPRQTAEQTSLGEKHMSMVSKVLSVVSENVGKSLFDAFRGSYELYFIVGVLGLISLVMAGSCRWEHLIPLLYAALNFVCFLSVVSAYRYFTVNIILFMPFTVAGFIWVAGVARRFKWGGIILAAVLVAVAITQVANGLSNLGGRDGRGERELGTWMKEHAAELRKPGYSGPLRILSRRPQYAFWSEGLQVPFDKSLEHDASRIAGLDFDVAVFERGEHELVRDLLGKRPDLTIWKQWNGYGFEVLRLGVR